MKGIKKKTFHSEGRIYDEQNQKEMHMFEVARWTFL